MHRCEPAEIFVVDSSSGSVNDDQDSVSGVGWGRGYRGADPIGRCKMKAIGDKDRDLEKHGQRGMAES